MIAANAAAVPALLAWAPAAAAATEPPALLGISVDFILFALTLLGVALFHRHTLYVALIGLATITLYKLGFTGRGRCTGCCCGVARWEAI